MCDIGNCFNFMKLLYTGIVVIHFCRWTGSRNEDSDVDKAVASYVSKYNRLTDADQTHLIVKM